MLSVKYIYWANFKYLHIFQNILWKYISNIFIFCVWDSLSVLKVTVSSAYRRLYTFSSLSWSSSLSSSSATGADEGHAAAENILTHFTASAWRACVYFSRYFSAHSLRFFSISQTILTDTHWHTCTLDQSPKGEVFKDVIGPAQCQSRKDPMGHGVSWTGQLSGKKNKLTQTFLTNALHRHALT